MSESIVAGALLRGGRVLLVHRRPDRLHFPDVWDLPGGHVEPGEDPPVALVRELSEELGVRAVVTGEAELHIEHRPGEEDGMRLDVWRVTAWKGEPANRAEDEHDDLRWVGPEGRPLGGLAHAELWPFLLDLLRSDAPSTRP